MLAALAAGGVAATAGAGRANGDGFPYRVVPVPQIHHPPRTSSVTWPSVSPPGWYTDTYKHAWYFPWYAYYNFSSGPYANWAAGGGYAGYASHGPAGYYYWGTEGGAGITPAGVPAGSVPDAGAAGAACTVAVTLPADAKLLFNGTAASGSGAVRKFQTPPLAPGQSYKYELTAEITRDGRTERVTETVIVRAGETATVTLTPSGVATVSK